ncbi:MAG: hypothetical protein D3908_16400, partial [Candidatus Electrothrix sp. AUS4]|nr:hypothetical protein [Candidatus Electrothrix sp. AUS4]
KKAGTFAIGLLLLPKAAAACGVCAYSEFEYLLPHVSYWCFGMMIWFCAVMMITSGKKDIPSVIIVLLLAILTGGAVFGPWSFMLLGFTAFCFTLQSCRPKIRQKLSKGKQIALKIVSLVAAVGMAAGLLISAQIKSTRSDADFVLQWGGYAVLQRLIAEKDTGQLRQILSQTKDDYMAEEITEALATIEENRAEQGENRAAP